MADNSLTAVYLSQLQTMASADRQSLELTRQLRDRASDDALREGLENGTCGSEEGLEKVLSVLEKHGLGDGNAPVSEAMAGLVADTKARVFDADLPDNAGRDAAIIAQYMQLTYYGLAGYKTLSEFAKRLGLSDDADALQTCYENAQDGQSDMHDLLSGKALEKAA